MQQKEIRYSGMTTRPSDHNSPDGELNISYNLVSEDGELKPLLPPRQVFTLPEYKKFFCIHKADNKDYYIIHNATNSLQSYRLIDNALTLHTTICNGEIKDVICVGNTLVIISEKAVAYALYQKSTYKYLGSKPPFIDMSFGLHGNFEVSDRFCSFDYDIPKGIVNTDGKQFGVASDHDVIVGSSCHLHSDYGAERVKDMFSGVLIAEINKFIQQRSVDNGKFIFPFFVRYAFRLYDGSHILQSAPILMLPNDYITSFLDNDETKSTAGSTAVSRIWSRIAAMICKLDYAVQSPSSSIATLKEWSDIVKSVDVFISSPIFTYDQNGKVIGWNSYAKSATKDEDWEDEDDGWMDKYKVISHAKIDNGNCFKDYDYLKYLDSREYYQERNFAQLYVRSNGMWATSNRKYAYSKGSSVFKCPSSMWALPRIDDKKLRENIANCSLFYKVASLEIDSLTTSGRKDVDISGDILKTLQQRERLQDDYLSHHTLTAGFAYNYNARLYLADIQQTIFNGFKPSTMLQTSDCHPSKQKIYTAYVFLRKEGKDMVVKETATRETSNKVLFLFYPDADAYKMILAQDNSPLKAKEFKLTPHNLLNGSYWFGDFEETTLSPISLPPVSSDLTIATPNKLFASEVNNPFFFPIKNRNNIGTSKIIAISSASKALSQGQFGQFPLYAFTLDGVWALEISGAGEISTKQPATRDVIHPNSSLLQIDGGIVFATEQGIMLLNGSESVSISDVLSGTGLSCSTLPHIEKLLEFFGLPGVKIDIIPFREYIKGCNLAYDYANSRIYVFNKSKGYGYIYSLKSNMWTLFTSSWQDVINNYPTSLVIDSERNVMDLSLLNRNATVKGMIITRPMGLDAPNVLKTITSSIHRTMAEPTATPTALYGSVDCNNFHLITSSSDKYIRSTHGSPYKYFVYAIGTNLKNGESISGTSLTYELKRSNKLR